MSRRVRQLLRFVPVVSAFPPPCLACVGWQGDMCLNHKLTGVEGIYDHYTYWKERRDAMTLLADFLVTH